MGHSVSATKRERQNAKRYAANRANRSALKKDLKKFDQSLSEKSLDAKKAFATIQSALDRAARKNAIPKGQASRKKARLARRLAKALAKPAAAPAKA
jgi:small subunit ribosomal protein S20